MKAILPFLLVLGLFFSHLYSAEVSLFEGKLLIVNNCDKCTITSNTTSYFTSLFQLINTNSTQIVSSQGAKQLTVTIESTSSYVLRLYTNKIIISKSIVSNQITAYSCDYWDNGKIRHEDRSLGNGKSFAANFNQDGYPLNSMTIDDKTEQFDGECRYYKESGSTLHKLTSGEIRTRLDYIEFYKNGTLLKKTWYEADGKTVKNEISY